MHKTTNSYPAQEPHIHVIMARYIILKMGNKKKGNRKECDKIDQYRMRNSITPDDGIQLHLNTPGFIYSLKPPPLKKLKVKR